MIVDRIFNLYEASERRKPSTGYPTASRLGTCTAQLQMLRFPGLTKPESPQPRDIMRWDEGFRTEDWLAEQLQGAFPDLVGMRQEPFYFRVPLPEGWMVDELRRQIARRKGSPDGPNLWGTEYADRPFVPPSMKVEDSGRVRMRLLPCGPKCDLSRPVEPHGWGCKKKQGLILDPLGADGPGVWVPTYIDFALLHATLGLTIVEAKSMSNFAFRRAVLGDLDFGKRMQLVAHVEATGLPVVLVAYRKETSHMAEIAYTPKANKVRVLLTKMNGQQEAFVVDQGVLKTEATGEAMDLPPDLMWNHAEVWTPYDPALVAMIHERVRRVLFARPGEWHREYGPTGFRCATCDGTGTQTRTKNGGELLKSGPKPCTDCGGVPGDKKAGVASKPGTGLLDEAELPSFPCGYCPVVMSCFAPAKVRLEIDTKPHYIIRREDWEASGLTFTPPEGPGTPPPAEVAEEVAA